MWRSDCESISLKVYVPAGSIWAPTPGISTGALNVTLVFLFHSSAFAPDGNARATRDKTKITPAILSLFTFFIGVTSLFSGAFFSAPSNRNRIKLPVDFLKHSTGLSSRPRINRACISERLKREFVALLLYPRLVFPSVQSRSPIWSILLMPVNEQSTVCGRLSIARANCGSSHPHVDPGDGMHNSKNIQEPQDHKNDHHGIQDRLDGTGHRDKAVDEPEKNTHYNQSDQNIN